jgi:hypothetical protein
MHVSVVEAGHYEFAAELDGLGAFVAASAFEHDLLDSADADDFAFADGHGGGPGMLGIVGVDAAVEVVAGAGRRVRLGCGGRWN